MEANKQMWQEHIQCIISQFRKLQIAPDTWTIPFVPWCGDQYWNARPRILFVGKSVGAFNDQDAEKWTTPIHKWQESGSPDPIALTNDYITSKVAVFKPANSAFWVVPFLIAGAFSPTNIDPQHLAHSFAWSNVYKVNNSERVNGTPTKDGLPTSKDLKCRCDKDFCLLHTSAQWLKREFEILQPDLVLLGITKEWKKVGQALSLPQKDEVRFPMKLDDSQVEQLKLGHRPKGIWVTYHFSSWSTSRKSCEHGKLLLEMRRVWEES
jgi:hypothetical protein